MWKHIIKNTHTETGLIFCISSLKDHKCILGGGTSTTVSLYQAGNMRGWSEMDACVHFNRHSGAAFHPHVLHTFSYITITQRHSHTWRHEDEYMCRHCTRIIIYCTKCLCLCYAMQNGRIQNSRVLVHAKKDWGARSVYTCGWVFVHNTAITAVTTALSLPWSHFIDREILGNIICICSSRCTDVTYMS